MKETVLERKQREVSELKDRIEQAKTIVAFDDAGLTVLETTELRTALHKEGSTMAVYKNNIARRAMELAGYGEISPELVGKKVLVFSNEDVVAPARIVYDFGKTNKKVVVKGGIVEGKVANLDAIVELATLPSYETLLTQLAAGLLMPLKELSIGLNMITELEQEQA